MRCTLKNDEKKHRDETEINRDTSHIPTLTKQLHSISNFKRIHKAEAHNKEIHTSKSYAIKHTSNRSNLLTIIRDNLLTIISGNSPEM